MIRIISGKLKGKKISAPKHFEVRPTTDFSKEALFSIITNRYTIPDISVLDLFSGIGSIDYEFASRGCKDITSVEMNEKHVKFIQDTTKILGISDINVVRQNVLSFLEKGSYKKYDIIFADPPFDWEDKQYENLIQSVLQHNFLSENGEFILEHNTRKDFSEFPNFTESRKYGNVRFSFFNFKN
ncbi:16S rRNA (guanine(966)-N(2))-methyltransferase RsmD [Apibacter mensalis]|uniref:16S rRNA (Guanine(966)-N(2))-methyltransferase RsmD n=1 Tax=Apibacter mensalis TaxID=1586267 RepID=A0A0X3AS31_9FLAO|nr:RsmD family RNA methyltransferase [Apibacter mensalis]CVK16688.1 16S rRNA (guanine(966)-N(2))-methyltransferase RsmD [Apibacter mensalis]